MNKNSVIILAEGKHEAIFIEDFRQNHGTFLSKCVVEVIPAGRIDHKFLEYADLKDEIYFVVDNDVESVNFKIRKVQESAKKAGVVFEALVQTPEFDTFCASFFKDFILKENWNFDVTKREARNFLAMKMPKIQPKKYTYTEILKAGGDIGFAKRYEEKFLILKYLVVNNVK